MRSKMKLKSSQAEPISVVILTGVVLAIALAVYGYFASQASLASYQQRVQAEIVKLKFNIVVSELYSNGTDHYILIKRLDTNVAKITFSIVLGETYGESILIYNQLTEGDQKARVYLLTYSNGFYIYTPVNVNTYIPLNKLYTSVDTPLYSGYLRGRGIALIPAYSLEAVQKLGAHGCEILLDVKFPSIVESGYPMLIVIESIGNEYYIVDVYQFPRRVLS